MRANGITATVSSLRPRAARRRRRISPFRRALWAVQLARGGVTLSTARLMQSLGVSRAQAKRDLRALREAGIIP